MISKIRGLSVFFLYFVKKHNRKTTLFRKEKMVYIYNTEQASKNTTAYWSTDSIFKHTKFR